VTAPAALKYNDSDSPSGANVLSGAYTTWDTVAVPLAENYVKQVYNWVSIPDGKAAGLYTSTFYYQAVKQP